jgi:hypothetical protein
MAKRKIPKVFDAFELAIRQMSIAQLRKLAVTFQKNTSECQTRDDYVDRLSLSMKHAERLKAMRDFVLAGQTSMSIYAIEFDGTDEAFSFEPEFTGTASREPEIVTVGKVDELIEGQQHVQWAVLTGQQSFLDIHLALKVEPESLVIDTFFEADTGYLQIRSSAMYAKRIAMHWAKLVGVDFETAARRISLTTPDQVDEFATQLAGSIRKCGGDKKESKGFLRVTGTRHPNLKDLRGTEDYKTFLGEVDPADFQIEFVHDKKEYALGINIEAGSLLFMSSTPEKTIQYIYSELKKYLAK